MPNLRFVGIANDELKEKRVRKDADCKHEKMLLTLPKKTNGGDKNEIYFVRKVERGKEN